MGSEMCIRDRPNGGFFIAWLDLSGNDSIRGQAFDVLGNRVGTETIINTADVGNGGTDSVSVSTLPDGRVVVAYQNSNFTIDGSSDAIQSQIIDPRNGVVFGGDGADQLYGNVFDEQISGRNGDDMLFGLDGRDVLLGGDGNDTLDGGQDNDILVGGRGSDTLIGGLGNDGAFYNGETSGATIRLDGIASSGSAAGDTFDSIENVVATNFDDAIVGNNDANILFGLAGNDTFFGSLGADIINGGDGNDTVDYSFLNAGVGVVARLDGLAGAGSNDILFEVENVTGTAFDDVFVGDANDNVFFGAAGNDRFFGSAGADLLIGGEGNNDTVDYTFASSRVVARLDGLANGDAAAGNQFSGIENLVGSNFNDLLVGASGDADNALFGGLGSDTFFFGDDFGNDIVGDFDITAAGENINLAFVSNITDFTDLANNHITNDVNGNAIIIDGDDTITLLGVNANSLGIDDFVF